MRRIGSNDFYPLTFYNNGGELVGMYGNFSEIRFLPSCNGRPSLVSNIDHRASNHFVHVHDFNDSLIDPLGLERLHRSEYVGDYELLRYGIPSDTISVTIRNGYLYVGESKCTEHETGLFFTLDGEAFDLRSDSPTIMNILLRKKEVQPE